MTKQELLTKLAAKFETWGEVEEKADFLCQLPSFPAIPAAVFDATMVNINEWAAERERWLESKLGPHQDEASLSKSDKPAITAPDIVSAAMGHMRDRAATYDAPDGERSMSKVVGAFRELTGIDMTEEQGHLFMCCLKIARATQGDFRLDNYEDLAAYAGLAGEAAAKGRA